MGNNQLRQMFLGSVRFYQKYLSFDTGVLKFLFLTDKACRFQPSCSEYVYQAICKYGILCGCWLGLKRILRCHPWSKGGYNPV